MVLFLAVLLRKCLIHIKHMFVQRVRGRGSLKTEQLLYCNVISIVSKGNFRFGANALFEWSVFP